MKSLANGVRGKRPRTCDNCVKRRAHWFCAADNAFLCQPCDTSVHSANALARRHVRVRLNSASPEDTKHNNQNHLASSQPQEAATWHHGFTRKPRTPRGSGKKNNLSTFHDVVPAISAEDQTDSSEVEEARICQVPVVDPSVVEARIEFPSGVVMIDDQEDKDNAESYLDGFLPSNMELVDLAADVEELELSNTEILKLKNDEMDQEKEEETKGINMDIVICDDDDDQDDRDGTMPFELTFDFDSQNTLEEDAIKNVESSGECVEVKEEEDRKNVLMLSLDHDLVISTWGGQGLPWTSGEPPELDIDISGSPVVSMGKNGGESKKKHRGCGRVPSSGIGDEGREARVSRYREKRKKRVFTKKIRYEIRKVYADKKPRLKGRFAKRASFAASAENSHH